MAPHVVGHQAGVVTVFPPPTGKGGDTPFQIPEGSFTTLERRSLAKMELDPAEVTDYAAAPTPETQVVNDAVGRFALWGFPEVADRKALPPPKPDDTK